MSYESSPFPSTAEIFYIRQIERLEAKLDALKADAERYRWLRDVGDETWVPLGKRRGVQFTHEIDAAIDAARRDDR